MMAHRRRGLGAQPVQDASGNVIDCSSIWNVFNSACYGVLGGSTGIALDASGNVDCSALQNVINGACSPASFATANPLLFLGTSLVLVLGVSWLMKQKL